MASPRPEWVLRSRRIVTGAGVVDGCIAIAGQKILGIHAPEQMPAGCPQVDVGEAVVSPGLVDTHVHVNEPGRTEWEGFETATRAAAAGGITTIVDMPLNSSPVTTTAEALRTKVQAAKGKVFVDCGFWGGLVPDNAGSLDELIDAGVAGVKAFLVPSGIDDFPMAREDDLRQGMPILARRRLPLLVHAEVPAEETKDAILDSRGGGDRPIRLGNRGDDSSSAADRSRRYATYLASRPPAMEVEAVRRMVELSRELGCRVHIVHLSAAEALEDVSRARRDGLPLSVETCPHYLTLSAEEIGDGRTEFKCAPPIRDKSNQERLWRGLAQGIIDAIVSDHSPCSPALKLSGTGNFLQAWGGVSSLQFTLPLIWSQACRRGFGLVDLARWMSAAPAELAGVQGRKGDIAPGHDADLLVWNPEEEFTLSPEMIQHRHRLTPYLGRTLRGAVKMTFLRGRKVYERGTFFGSPAGEILLRGAADG